MGDFRLYYFETGDDGVAHIVGRTEFACESPERAIAWVSAQFDGRMLELWSGTTLVRTWPGSAQSAVAH